MSGIYRSFEFVRQGNISEEAIKENNEKDIEISEATKERVNELGLKSIANSSTFTVGKTLGQLATIVKQRGGDLKKHVPLLFAKKFDYKSAVNFLEVLCIYGWCVKETHGSLQTIQGKDKRIDFDMPVLKALKELEEINDMLNVKGKINSTTWKAKVKRIKHLVDKVFLNDFDDIQRDALSKYLEDAKKILSK